MRIWERADPSKARTIPFNCRSWRCPGDCRAWVFKQDFARVVEGVKKRSDWTYFVFTYDQRRWPSQWAMYRRGGSMWDLFRKRITREWGKIAYVQTWEAHKTGCPHVNVLIGNERIHAVSSLWPDDYIDPWWIEHATASGFGEVAYGRPMRSRANMAFYLTKLANELSGAGEKDQVPITAPAHFRRLRASHGLLPPRFKDDRFTGRLHKCTVEQFAVCERLLKRLGESVIKDTTTTGRGPRPLKGTLCSP